jgi:hypothetical protein
MTPSHSVRNAILRQIIRHVGVTDAAHDAVMWRQARHIDVSASCQRAWKCAASRRFSAAAIRRFPL